MLAGNSSVLHVIHAIVIPTTCQGLGFGHDAALLLLSHSLSLHCA